MNISHTEDCRIETRFVWARCDAENARELRGLIKAFQSDGWDLADCARETGLRRKHSRRLVNH